MTAEREMLAERARPVHIPSEWELAQMALEPLRALARWCVKEIGWLWTLQALQGLVREIEEMREKGPRSTL